MQSKIKCPSCGTINVNRDYCKECGALINHAISRQIELDKKAAEKKKNEKDKKPGAFSSFIENSKSHPNFFVRLTGKAFYSVWVIILVVGGALALAFAYIAA